MNNESRLKVLAAQLGRCSSGSTHGFRETAAEAWEDLRNQRLPSKPSASIVAALVIEDPMVGQLLTFPEREELLRLANAAMDRYDRRSNPSNKVGNLIAGVLKEL
jgi:hypothetical protein